MSVMSDSRLDELEQRLEQLGIPPAELEERFVRSGGPGGQHANKSSTAVQLSHPPSGLEVRVDSERSQLQNRVEARERLIQQVEASRAQAEAEERDARERERRRKRRPPPAARRRTVAGKRRRGEVKRRRGRVERDDD
jgi:ribosome-associated protein